MNAPQSTHSKKPEWIRLPKAGQLEPNTGLGRTKLNQLILPTKDRPTPPVHSISVREPHQKRGVRLIHLQSLLDYLEGIDRAASPPKVRFGFRQMLKNVAAQVAKIFKKT